MPTDLCPLTINASDLQKLVRQRFQEHQVPTAFSVSTREVVQELKRSDVLHSLPPVFGEDA